MSYPQRHSTPTQIIAGERTFFITSCTWGRRSLLQSARAAGLFVGTIRHYQAERKFRLHAFVAMPDHFHLLITVNVGMTIERAIQFVKGGFAYRAGRELGFTSPVWQKGFSEVRVLDAQAFENQLEYIHQNPVRARLVERAELYPYSSAGDLSQIDPAPAWLQMAKIGA